MTAPLVLTADPLLRDDLVRFSAAAGITPEVVSTPAQALRSWSAAPLVVVGSDLAQPLAALAPARRDDVHVVGHGPLADDLFRLAVQLGAVAVAELPASEQWLVELLGDTGELRRGPGHVLGVVGGSGGAGASTLACALGQSAARHGDALVIDADPLGPGLDRLLGIDGIDGTRWESLTHSTGRLSARALREAVPRRGTLGVLTWSAGITPIVHPFSVREAISAGRRGHDVVIVDIPRASDPLQEGLATRCDVVLMVVVPTVAGVASAARWCAQHASETTPHLVVRGTGMAERAIASACRAPVLTVMGDQRGLGEAVDLGFGPLRSGRGPLGRATAAILGSMVVREAA